MMKASTIGWATTAALVCAVLWQPVLSAAEEGTLSKGDRRFVENAAKANLFEVQTGRIAAEKGSTDEVKTFARQMVTDHSANNDELKAIAKEKGVEWPETVETGKQGEIEKLQKMPGTDLDKEYMEMMTRDHMKVIEMFEKAEKSCEDPALKAYIGKSLPVLRQHLEKARTLPGSKKD